MFIFRYKPQLYRPVGQLDFHHISLSAFPDKEKKTCFSQGSWDLQISQESNLKSAKFIYIYIYIYVCVCVCVCVCFKFKWLKAQFNCREGTQTRPQYWDKAFHESKINVGAACNSNSYISLQLLTPQLEIKITGSENVCMDRLCIIKKRIYCDSSQCVLRG